MNETILSFCIPTDKGDELVKRCVMSIIEIDDTK